MMGEMMSQFIEFPLEGTETTVIVEVDDDAAGIIPVGIEPGEVARRATQGFQQALDRILPVASAALGRMRTLSEIPDEVTISFGIKLTADLGAVLARAGSAANLDVMLRWERKS